MIPEIQLNKKDLTPSNLLMNSRDILIARRLFAFVHTVTAVVQMIAIAMGFDILSDADAYGHWPHWDRANSIGLSLGVVAMCDTTPRTLSQSLGVMESDTDGDGVEGDALK